MAKDAGLTIIADRYANAILSLAEQKDCTHYVKTDLNTVTATINENPDLQMFLKHPIIPVREKKEVLETIFKDKINPYLLNLIKLLLDRNRLYALNTINISFIKLYNKKYNIAVAEITTAIMIDENIQNAIKQKLSEIMSMQIDLHSKIEPAVIGGMLIKIDDKVIDGTISGRLESIKKQII
jgi:F-type H+-transporting ATPase subunit delta